MPAPSPATFRALLHELPAEFRQAIKDEPAFACLDRELQQLEAAIASVDQIARVSAPSSQPAPIEREAARREARAFRRCAIVATAIVSNTAATPEQNALALAVTIAAGQATAADEDFPWLQLRQVLAVIAQL